MKKFLSLILCLMLMAACIPVHSEEAATVGTMQLPETLLNEMFSSHDGFQITVKDADGVPQFDLGAVRDAANGRDLVMFYREGDDILHVT